MRVHFTRNYHVPVSECSRRMYKAGRVYDVSDEVAKAAMGAKRAKRAADDQERPGGQETHASAE